MSKIITPFDLSSASQLRNVAGVTPTTTDLRGTGVQETEREWGALEYDNSLYYLASEGDSLATPFDLSSESQIINVAGTTPTSTDLRGTSAIGSVREWGALEYDSSLVLSGVAPTAVFPACRFVSDLRGTRQLAFNLRPADSEGAPTSGLYLAGDLYMDSEWVLWKCVSTGVPGTFVKLMDQSHDHSGGDGAQIDHGGLSGLSDDDHAQYHNDTRGDARYSQLGHSHTESDITDLDHDADKIKGVTVDLAGIADQDVLKYDLATNTIIPGAASAGGTNPAWYIDGALAVATSVGIAWIAPSAMTITAVYIHCKTKGSAGSTIVDVHKNGTTIFTTQASRPTLAYDDADGVAVSATPDVTTLAAGDVLTFDIDQVAAGAAGLSIIVGLESSAGDRTAIPGVLQGRLTLTSGDPIAASDVTGATTLYLTPYKGNLVSLYNGSNWVYRTLTEISLSLAGLTASTPYDIFLYNNSGTLTLEAVAWTNATTRATELATQDGVYVKSGAAGRLYVGTIYINANGGQTDDSETARGVWNFYNGVQKYLIYNYETQHTYNSATERLVNGTSAPHTTTVFGNNTTVYATVKAYHSMASNSYLIAIGKLENSSGEPVSAGTGRYSLLNNDYQMAEVSDAGVATAGSYQFNAYESVAAGNLTIYVIRIFASWIG